jgi:hypothetical protein
MLHAFVTHPPRHCVPHRLEPRHETGSGGCLSPVSQVVAAGEPPVIRECRVIRQFPAASVFGRKAHIAFSRRWPAEHSNGHLGPSAHVCERADKSPAAGREHKPKLLFRHARAESNRKNCGKRSRELLEHQVVSAQAADRRR